MKKIDTYEDFLQLTTTELRELIRQKTSLDDAKRISRYFRRSIEELKNKHQDVSVCEDVNDVTTYNLIHSNGDSNE